MLRPAGRLVALTPSGTGNVTPAVLRQMGANPHNWTFFLWRSLTASSGRAWVRDGVLAAFAQRHAATYRQIQVFGGLATLEIIARAERDEVVDHSLDEGRSDWAVQRVNEA